MLFRLLASAAERMDLPPLEVERIGFAEIDTRV